MENKPTRSDKRSIATPVVLLLLVLVVIALPVLYVLSIGPMFLFVASPAGEVPQWFASLYAPVIWLAGKSPFTETLFFRYLDLWKP